MLFLIFMSITVAVGAGFVVVRRKRKTGPAEAR
jgi:LPXTG-motif cell wall-anchored protein